MSSNESAAYKIMRSLDVDYVLIIFGGVIGYSGDDINKFLWMVRIAEGEHPKDIRVSVRQQLPVTAAFLQESTHTAVKSMFPLLSYTLALYNDAEGQTLFSPLWCIHDMLSVLGGTS